MAESTNPESRADRPSRQETFRFAGVELRPEDSPQEKIRDLAAAELWKNSVGSILIGVGLASALLYTEKLLADVEFLSYRLPEPYPYFSHGLPWFLLFFYIGWALYWGIRDCLNADMMGEQHGANRFLGGLADAQNRALPWMRWLGANTIALGAYGVMVVMISTIIIYSLL